MDNLNLANKSIDLENKVEDFDLNSDLPESNDSTAVDTTTEVYDVADDNINNNTNSDTQSCESTNSEECTALVEVKNNSLWVAQKMFKKSIKISIKSFLISLSLGFLNLFF